MTNHNTGNLNTGDFNTGHHNTGDFNTGDWNTGNLNTGHLNTGDFNIGNLNIGDFNTGHHNTGHYNTGDFNTGNLNTGHLNTGDFNTGHHNTGHHNTGDFNTGDFNTGYFCEKDGPVMFFDAPCNMSREEAAEVIPLIDLPVGAVWVPRSDMTEDEVVKNPNCEKLGGYLKVCALPITEAMPQVWPTLGVEVRKKFIALPNFDADKFQRMTGVDVRMDKDLLPVIVESPKRIFIDGVEYELVPVSIPG